MKIKELKQILENYPDDLEIVLSKDTEGNEFRPLYPIEKCDDGLPREVFGCNQKYWNFEVHYTKEPSLVLFLIG
jgi:hypothetical protein